MKSYKKQVSISLSDRCTNMRLEQPFIDALDDAVLLRGDKNRSQLVRHIDHARERGMSLTSAVKVFLILFYRNRHIDPLVGFCAALGMVYRAGGQDYAEEAFKESGHTLQDFFDAGVDDAGDIEVLRKVYGL